MATTQIPQTRPETIVVDDWTRMETRLVLYKAGRLLDELERELKTLRAHVEDPTIRASVVSTASLIEDAQDVMGDLRSRL